MCVCRALLPCLINWLPIVKVRKGPPSDFPRSLDTHKDFNLNPNNRTGSPGEIVTEIVASLFFFVVAL